MVFWAQILYYRSIERSTTARRMGCDEVCTICSEEELAMMKSVSVWKQELAGGAHTERLASLYCCAPEQTPAQAARYAAVLDGLEKTFGAHT